MQLNESEIRSHLISALAALDLFEKKCEILDRENERWRSERELMAGHLKVELGEGLYEACCRLRSDWITERTRREEAEKLLKCARRDVIEGQDRIAGLLKERETKKEQ